MIFSNKSIFFLSFILLLITTYSVQNSYIYIDPQSQYSPNAQKTNIQQDLNEDNNSIKDIKICDGNRFQYMSSFVLGRQNDLTKTFEQIQKTIQLKNITYSDKVGRQYRIYNFKPHLVYLQSRQVAQVRSLNVLNISGGSVRVTYNFDWQKQQIGSSIKGNGSGLVSTNTVTFQKILQTNDNHQLEWVLSKALPVNISNSLTLSKVDPYKEADFEIINQMLNQLKNNDTTVKRQLILALNSNFTSILRAIVKQDQTIKIPKTIEYNYSDYRGPFDVTFDNLLLQNSLSKSGLSLLLSQVITDDKNFQCGEKVPDQPQNQSKYGGTQQYISNKFFKSSLKYALQRHFLDATLSQDDWQSRAFQFYMGDLHDAIIQTRNVSSFKQLNGKCQAIDDKTFSFDKKSITSYAVVANFSCSLLDNQTKIVDIVLPVQYQIVPTLTNSQLNFVIKSIKGTPKFIQSAKYKLTNTDLAAFMLSQTLNTATNSKVIGSGLKTRNRKVPRLQVRDGYLFLYDKSSINVNNKN